jgi:hypothetical protein
MSKVETLKVVQKALANTNYTLLVSGVEGEDTLVTNVFVNNDSSGSKVVSIARVPRGATAGTQHNIVVTASLATKTATKVELNGLLPGVGSQFDIYVKGDADVVVTADVRVV